MYEASSPSGVHPLPYRYRRQGAQEENGPCHCRQLCCSQASPGAGMDQQTSAVRIPLHPDVTLLTPCRLTIFCYTTKNPLNLAVCRPLEELKHAIHHFLDDINANPMPFPWTKDPNKIIAAVKRGHQVLDSIH